MLRYMWLNDYTHLPATTDPTAHSNTKPIAIVTLKVDFQLSLDAEPGNYHKITLTRKGHANGLPDLKRANPLAVSLPKETVEARECVGTVLHVW